LDDITPVSAVHIEYWFVKNLGDAAYIQEGKRGRIRGMEENGGKALQTATNTFASLFAA
jgi:hypothetical protein